MKIYNFIGKFDVGVLRSDLLAAYPGWHIEQPGVAIDLFGIDYFDERNLRLDLPDDADDAVINQIIDRHDPAAVTPEQYWLNYYQARIGFLNLPDWATWTATEAETNITNAVLSGQTKAQVDEYIDTNVTTLATARTALKLLAGAVIDIRTIISLMAKMLVFLRDIVVRR